MNTIEEMRQRLTALSPESIEILDESGQHIGHEGAKGGGGHYQLLLVTARFSGLSLPARHRMVYDALGPMMHQAIHALSIKAYAPDEI
ncbi:MAG TPA: BolA family protein [Burkholderiales bacterium]|nr:BolA family protein [Burkholderiales bacterium]